MSMFFVRFLSTFKNSECFIFDLELNGNFFNFEFHQTKFYAVQKPTYDLPNCHNNLIYSIIGIKCVTCVVWIMCAYVKINKILTSDILFFLMLNKTLKYNDEWRIFDVKIWMAPAFQNQTFNNYYCSFLRFFFM